MKIIYIAEDGTQFDDEFECESYEGKLNHPYLKNIVFYDIKDNFYTIGDDIYICQCH